MDPEKLNHFKQLLLDKRKGALLTMGLSEHNSARHKMMEIYSDEKYSSDLADTATDTMISESETYLKARGGKFLKHIDEALKRIEKGDYGICVNCGHTISEERLEAVPHTQYCVPCKAKGKITS